jgi:hypothetical protein
MTLPIVLPSADVFFASAKRVLAHYVELFQVQIDNVDAAVDYWARNWMVPQGEGNKFLAQGGMVRGRPLAVTLLGDPNYPLTNKKNEVKNALARGITGFTYDLQNFADDILPTGKFATMLNAMAAVDSRFWGVITFDMSVGFTQAQIVQIISLYADKAKWPNIARWSDGRIIISAFNAGKQLPAWWQVPFAQLNAQGINIAFIPILLGNPGATGPLSPISLGLAGWGTARPDVAAAGPANFMSPILAQQFRPGSSVFWEAGNSATLRASWLTAINGGSDLVQLVTYNDFSESSQFQAYTDSSLNPNIGTWVSDVSAYFAAWFATGQQPTITKDVLYPIYRKMKSTDPHPNQSKPCVIVAGQPPETSNIECLAFLTAPGTILINGVATACPAGITSVLAPVAPGVPKFALQRNGSNVFSFNGPVTIGPNAQGNTDLTYWGSSASAN